MNTPPPLPAPALGAQAVLHTWEQVQAWHPLQRAAALLQLAWPEVPAAGWQALPLGVRDERLFALHEALFGDALELRVECPACGEPLELSLRGADLRPTAPPDGDAAVQPLQLAGHTLTYRLPSGADLLAAAGAPTAEAAVATLLGRCVLQAQRAGEAIAPADLPPPVVEQLQQQMAAHDPGADLRMALACPACGHGFERRFDIASHLWDALDDWAERTLAEVHTLASAYGWSEPQVLSLSAARRQRYIAMVQA